MLAFVRRLDSEGLDKRGGGGLESSEVGEVGGVRGNRGGSGGGGRSGLGLSEVLELLGGVKKTHGRKLFLGGGGLRSSGGLLGGLDNYDIQS